LRITLGIKVSHRMLAEDPLCRRPCCWNHYWYYSFWFCLVCSTFSLFVISATTWNAFLFCYPKNLPRDLVG
jgi:hypothetical protein